MPKDVAVIVTDYLRGSHTDVIAAKIYEGYEHKNDNHKPDLTVVSMYLHRPDPDFDMGRVKGKKHHFVPADTIAEALALGGKLVDGVLLIAEHGDYGLNAYGQKLYPKKVFFDEVFDVFKAEKKVVPVFNSKHLATESTDAWSIFKEIQFLEVPMIAGSVVPWTWRDLEVPLPLKSSVYEAIQIGFGDMETYGFHALEGMQCMLERRLHGETGVRGFQFFGGPQIWGAYRDSGRSLPLLDEALLRILYHAPLGNPRDLIGQDRDGGLCLIDYKDGTKATMIMANGWARESPDGIMHLPFICSFRGGGPNFAVTFQLQLYSPYGHFRYLLEDVDKMIKTGKTDFPLERTLLTTCMLDLMMKQRGGQTVAWPNLDQIRYQPWNQNFGRLPMPAYVDRKEAI